MSTMFDTSSQTSCSSQQATQCILSADLELFLRPMKDTGMVAFTKRVNKGFFHPASMLTPEELRILNVFQTTYVTFIFPESIDSRSHITVLLESGDNPPCRKYSHRSINGVILESPNFREVVRSLEQDTRYSSIQWYTLTDVNNKAMQCILNNPVKHSIVIHRDNVNNTNDENSVPETQARMHSLYDDIRSKKDNDRFVDPFKLEQLRPDCPFYILWRNVIVNDFKAECDVMLSRIQETELESAEKKNKFRIYYMYDREAIMKLVSQRDERSIGFCKASA